MRFGIYAGGLTLSDPQVTAYAGGAIVSWFTGRSGWEPRFYATLYRVETNSTITTGAAFQVQSTYWFGAYGFGVGAGLGYAEFAANHEGGAAGEPSAQVLFFFAPVMLRLGESPQLELGIKLGSTRFVARDDIEPFGYFFAALHF